MIPFTDIVKMIPLTPYYLDLEYGQAIYCADCRDLLPVFGHVFSTVVTDPPYGLGFMGKEWDTFDKSQFGRKGSEGANDLKVKKNFNILPRYNGSGLYEFIYECAGLIRSACLPGAPLLSFGGSRTQHRIACAIEDAGWVIKDTLMWVYGSGFPKSLDISKAIDKMKGIEREVIGVGKSGQPDSHKTSYQMSQQKDNTFGGEFNLTAPASAEAQLWNGYGTALKPAYEPIILAMNPLDNTFANNALKYGVAGLNIDECRVQLNGDRPQAGKRTATFGTQETISGGDGSGGWDMNNKGRFPANFLHDGSQEVMELFPKTGKSSGGKSGHTGAYGGGYKEEYYNGDKPGFGDNGSAARFFYCAKASRAERNRGCEDLPNHNPCYESHRPNYRNTKGIETPFAGTGRTGNNLRNNHPTVKPLALMEYLVKLVKMPEYNLVLDPFCGSGTTLLACGNLGIHSIGIDSDEQSCEIAKKRLSQSVMRL